VLDELSVAEVLRFHTPPAAVISHGGWLMPGRCVSSPSPGVADFWPESPPFC
jgi:hypothetical protein